jgi:hypothetical protein
MKAMTQVLNIFEKMYKKPPFGLCGIEGYEICGNQGFLKIKPCLIQREVWIRHGYPLIIPLNYEYICGFCQLKNKCFINYWRN